MPSEMPARSFGAPTRRHTRLVTLSMPPFRGSCPPLISRCPLSLDILGNAAFTPVKADLTGNIKKVRERLLAHPGSSATLEALVANEGKPGDKTRTATQGLLWLVRGLKFTCQGLSHSLANPSEELSVSFTKAYEETLKQYHSMFVKPVFMVRYPCFIVATQSCILTHLLPRTARDEGLPVSKGLLPQAWLARGDRSVALPMCLCSFL
jgi:hypothetical protein